MAKTSDDKAIQLEEQALVIANEIFSLINQFTNDSSVAKFFLSDEIATVCYSLSASFASLSYEPELDPEETIDSASLSFLYALLTYGFNIYLKERSLKTNAAPYVLPTEKKVIKQAQRITLSLTAKRQLISTPLADKIVLLLLENIQQQMDMTEFGQPEHTFLKPKFWDYTKLSLYWGYNFASELIDPKPKRKRQVD